MDVVKVSSLVEKAAKEVNDADIDPAVVSIFGTICEAMRGICTVQDKIVTALLKSKSADPVPVTPGIQSEFQMVSLGAVPKRHRGQISSSQPVLGSNTEPELVPVAGRAADKAAKDTVNARPPSSQVQVSGTHPPKEREDPAIRKFKDCIRDAERSSLILNLNLGRIPVVNKETMSKRATLALTTLAAKKENKKGTIPSSESVGAIDDVLSVVKNISFFGSGTKSYSNEKDELSGAYCTAPVKYEF
jgi:hypothetical protein